MSDREEFISKRASLFWSVGDLSKVSDILLVETILNYGSWEDVKELIQLLGISRTAKLFRDTTEGRARDNYFPEVKNYFYVIFYAPCSNCILKY